MISKELLSELLNNIVSNCRASGKWVIYNECYDDDMLGYMNINIYELANKCKEYIVDNGYALKICYALENNTRELCFIETTLLKSNQYSPDYYDMESNNEVEAIIKASEWVLKQTMMKSEG